MDLLAACRLGLKSLVYPWSSKPCSVQPQMVHQQLGFESAVDGYHDMRGNHRDHKGKDKVYENPSPNQFHMDRGGGICLDKLSYQLLFQLLQAASPPSRRKFARLRATGEPGRHCHPRFVVHATHRRIGIDVGGLSARRLGTVSAVWGLLELVRRVEGELLLLRECFWEARGRGVIRKM